METGCSNCDKRTYVFLFPFRIFQSRCFYKSSVTGARFNWSKLVITVVTPVNGISTTCVISIRSAVHTGADILYKLTVARKPSSSCSLPLLERCRFHDCMPQFSVTCSVPGRPQSQVLLFEVVLYHTQPCLWRVTAGLSPLLRRIVDASVEGLCVVHIWIRTDDVAEEPQAPGHNRLGGTDANFLVGDMRKYSTHNS